MATIVFDEEIDPIVGSVQGLTFATSQAGAYVKRRPSPIQHQTTDLMNLRSILSSAGRFYWSLNNAQKKVWAIWAEAQGIPKPFPNGLYQWGNAGFLSVNVNARLAGDPFYATHPPHNPTIPPTWLTLTRIDRDTIRVTFNPSANWNLKRIYLRQGIPGPGNKRWAPDDGYITQYSPLNPNSPFDFTTHFPHLAGWNGRYWLGCQRTCGCRSAEELWDI